MSDFSFDEGATGVAPDSLDRLNRKLEEAMSLNSSIEQMEDDLKAAKKQLNFLNTSIIPDMMAELGMTSTTQRGYEVKISEFVNGSLPKEPEKRMKAINWLENHDGGDLIKTNMTINFSKSQHNEALDLAVRITEEGFAPTVESTVHPQTLMAYARERMKNGEVLDIETLGLFAGRVAKYTKVKG